MNAATAGFYDGCAQSGRARIAPGVELYHETDGSGSPVTLVNNFFMVAPYWRVFTRRLTTRHRVVGYDLRNQGMSVSDGGPIGPRQHLDDLARLLDHLGIDRTAVVGASASTLIARDFAIAYPDRVSALVLAGPIFAAVGGSRRRRLIRSWLRSLEAGGPAMLFDHIYPLIFSEETIENGGGAGYLTVREHFLAVATPEQAAANLRASLEMPDEPARLREITCPTLVITGDSDFLTSTTSLDAIAALIPTCSTVVLPFAGHVSFFEAAEAFEAAVVAFLAEVEAKVETEGARTTRDTAVAAVTR